MKNGYPLISKIALGGLLLTIALEGCTVGPKYVRPATDVPSDYKEARSEFKQAEPRDQIAKGKWWEIYDDPQLNSVEERISVSNQPVRPAAVTSSAQTIKAPMASAYGTVGRLAISNAAPGVDQAITIGAR